jgi:hypothetical protein
MADDAQEPTRSVAPLVKALAKLGDELEQAFDSQPDRISAKDQRARYVYALRAISDFLRAAGAKLPYVNRLWRLAIALDDLNQGIVDPLLKEMATGGLRPAGDTWLWCARANVALGMCVLIESGFNRTEAAQRAARDYPKISKLAAFDKDQGTTETKILNWYDEFRKGRAKSRIKNTLAHSIFETPQQEIALAVQDFTAGPDQSKAHLFAFADYFFAKALEMGLRK